MTSPLTARAGDHADHFSDAAGALVDAGEALHLRVGDQTVTCTGSVARAVLALLHADSSPIDDLPAELTTGQVAGLLGVSRPTVVGLIDSGDLPATRVGSHRRVRAVDALAYRDRHRAQRRAALDDLTRLSEDMGLYEERS